MSDGDCDSPLETQTATVMAGEKMDEQSSTADDTCNSFISLPPELREMIISHLDPLDQFMLAACSKNTRDLMKEYDLKEVVVYNIAKGSLSLDKYNISWTYRSLESDAFQISDKNRAFLAFMQCIATDTSDLILDVTGCDLAMLSRFLSAINVPGLSKNSEFCLQLVSNADSGDWVRLCDEGNIALWSRVVKQLSELFDTNDLSLMFRCGCSSETCTAIGAAVYKHWKKKDRLVTLSGALFSPFDFFDGRFSCLRGCEDHSVYRGMNADMRIDSLRKLEKLIKERRSDRDVEVPLFLLQLEGCTGLDSDPRVHRFKTFIAQFPVEAVDVDWSADGRSVTHCVHRVAGGGENDDVLVRVWERESCGGLTVECYGRGHGSENEMYETFG